MSGRVLSVIVIGWMWLGAVAQAPAAETESAHDQSPAKRLVTVADAIEMTQIADRSYLDGFAKAGNVVQFSPDGSRFWFVVQKGSLKDDTVEFSLLVFKTVDVFTAPHPEVVAALASSSNREAISHVTWLPDNDTLLFLGEQPGEIPQLYSVSSTTKKLQRLTSHPTPVTSYSVSDSGDSLIYVAEANDKPFIISEEMRRRGFAITSQRWESLYQDHATSAIPLKEIFVKTGGMEAPKRIGNPLYLTSPESLALKMSPDGRFALLDAFVTNPPPIWNEYVATPETEISTNACSLTALYACPEQYLLVDVEKDTIGPLMNAPLFPGVSSGVELFSWTKQNSILLVNARLPLDISERGERSKRQRNVYVAEIVPLGGKLLKIKEQEAPFPGNDIQSDIENSRFIIQPSNAVYGAPTEFRKEAGGWKIAELQSSTSELTGHLSVTLDQGLNLPPKLVASDLKTRHPSVLLDLNPQFVDFAFGRVETFRWKTHDGRDGEGSLYYPPDYAPGIKYPLVIQTHGTSRERFWIDGPFSTANAAQPLAGRGFMVLQLGIGDRYNKSSLDEVAKVMDTSEEAPYSTMFLDAAIDELDRRGMIDPSRVGITGFSRTVYHTLYALTHSKYRIAAAALADGVNFGYAGCVFYMVENASSLCEKMNGGGPPFGPTLAGWTKIAPTFNLDKIEAPVLLQAISAPLGEWEILEGLRWLKKPVELLNFYPEGEHVLVRPQQRLLSQGSVVDWYCFWLKAEEDSDPRKADQYKRWHELRKLQEQNEKKPANAASPTSN